MIPENLKRSIERESRIHRQYQDVIEMLRRERAYHRKVKITRPKSSKHV